MGALVASDALTERRPARRQGSLRRELGNVPNLLTLARVAVIPPFVLFTYAADPFHSFVAAILFSAAAVTDVLDGFLARRLNLVTVMGKFLDPLADKLIVMAALVMLVRLGRVTAVVVILLLARELAISGLRTIAISEGLVIDASQGGKWKTSLQVTGIVALLVHYRYPIDFLVGRATIDFNAVGSWILYLSVISSYASAYGYFRAFWRKLSEV